MSEQQQQSAQNESNQTTVSELLSSLVESASQQAQQTREMHRNIKKLRQEVDREQKRLQRSSKPRRTVRQRPVSVNSAMKKFLEKQGVQAEDGGYTRQSMMKAVSAYIKTKELQLAENRKSWKADKTLVGLFNLDAKETYTFMNINGLLSRVVETKK